MIVMLFILILIALINYTISLIHNCNNNLDAERNCKIEAIFFVLLALAFKYL